MASETITKLPLASDPEWLTDQLRRLERVAALLDTSRAAADTLSALLKDLAESLGTELSSVQLRAEDGRNLLGPIVRGVPEEFVGAIAPVMVSADGTPVVVTDTAEDPRWAPYLERSEVLGIRAVWSVPIRSTSGQVLGCLTNYYRYPHSPREREVELARVYARCAAVAIENLRIKEAFEENRAELESIIEQMPEGVFIARAPDGVPLLMNRAGSRLLGHPPRGIIVSEYHQYVTLLYTDGREVPAQDRPMARALRGESARDQEYLSITRDGKPRHLLMNYGPLHHPGDTIFGGVVIFRDVSEQKRAEDALRKSEERYRTLVEQASVGIFIADQSGTYLDANTTGCLMLGYSREELLGKSAIELVGNNSGALKAAFAEATRGGTTQLETNLERRDSTILRAEISIKRLPDSHLLVITRDITERKRAEEELQRQGRLLRGVAEATSCLLAVADHDAAVRAALSRLGEASQADRVYIFEVHPGGASGATLLSQRYEWVREGVEPQLNDPRFQNMPLSGAGISSWYRLLAAGQPVSGLLRELPEFERKLLAGGGILSVLVVPIFIGSDLWGLIGFDDCHSERRWSESEESILKAAGAAIGAAISRKRAAEALRASEERFSSAFHSNPNPMSITSFKDGRYIDVNEGFTRTFGYTREEATGRTTLELGIWSSADERARFIELLQKGGAVRNLEVTLRTKSGEPRVFLLSAEQLVLGGELCILAATNDITQRKRAEEALRASEERFSIAFNKSPLAMCILNLKNGNFIAVNDSFVRITGYTREEAIGRTSVDLDMWVNPEDRLTLLKLLSQDGMVRDLEVQLRFKSGETCVGLFSAELIELGGEQCVLTTTSDITERKKTEEALRASEERFSKAFNASPLPMGINNLRSGVYIAVNHAFELLSGYSHEEVVGRTPAELGIWAAPEEHDRLLEVLKQRKTIRDLEIRYRTKSGEVRVGLLSGELIELDGERCLLTTTNDITERKQREEELMAARREWQTTFDAMTDNVLLIDVEDRLIRANRAFYGRLGLRPEECIGRPVRELLHRDGLGFLNADDCPICQLRTKGRRAAIELPAGVVSSFPIFASIDPIVDGNGRTIAVVQVARDLSALYRAREEAERERTSLIATIEQMAEGLIVCNEQGAVIHANRHVQEIFGYSLAEMRADTTASLPRGRFLDADGQVCDVPDLPIQVALTQQKVVDSRRLWYRRPDGRRLLLSVTASPFFSEQGRLAGAVALVRDVTEQQREHERTQQADKLRALGQLASGVAHNFNNALAAVIGYTQLGLRKVKDPEVEKYLSVIEQSAKDAARMVERIQNFSRRRTRTDDFVLLPICEVVRDAVEITQPRWLYDAEVLGIKYDVTVDWQAPQDLLVKGEASELREVFVNIIFNSLDAMPTGGALKIVGLASGTSVGVSFADTGTGMTEEIKRRVFEPFFTTKGVAGLGMGMSESYRIIERHGGRIDIESQLHRGSTFTVTLPLGRPVPEPAGLQPSGVALPKLRVLVIDDEEPVRKVLAAMLEELGQEVMQASSGEEGIGLLDQIKFDVVFTDLAMPQVDGITVAVEAKSRSPQVKVVLMSGYGTDRIFERQGGSEVVDMCICKPFSFVEIQELLEELAAEQQG